MTTDLNEYIQRLEAENLRLQDLIKKMQKVACDSCFNLGFKEGMERIREGID